MDIFMLLKPNYAKNQNDSSGINFLSTKGTHGSSFKKM